MAGTGGITQHPMYYANNGGLRYEDVIQGLVHCVFPEQVDVPADPVDLKWFVEYLKTHGLEPKWLRKDAMSGQLSKKHRVSLNLVEEWSGLARDMNALSRTDIVCALEVINPNVFHPGNMEQLIEYTVVMLRPAFFYEIGLDGWTALPHLLKQIGRQVIIERSGQAIENHDFKHPWSPGVQNTVPDIDMLKEYLGFQNWGK